MPRRLPFAPLALLLTALAACSESATPPAANQGSDAAPAALGSTEAAAAATPAAMPAATPHDVMRDVFAKFKALRSYQANMRIEGAPQGPLNNDMQFVAPDRYRLTMQAGGMDMTQVRIGNDVYTQVGGRTMKTSLPEHADPARWHEEFDRNLGTMTVEAQGSETLDGTATRKYLMKQTEPKPSDVAVWIDGEDHVRQARIEMQVEGRPTTTTIVYSRFDDPSIRIDPPN